MIVHPDFRSHWKTRRLVEVTGDKESPLWLISLWGYCQLQKRFTFEKGELVRCLAGVCMATIKGDKLLSFFTDCGFVRIDGETVTIHDWEKANRMFVSAWTNGRQGGRPANRPDNQTGTDRKPTMRAHAHTRAEREKEKEKVRFPTGFADQSAQNPNSTGSTALEPTGFFVDGEGKTKLRLIADQEPKPQDSERYANRDKVLALTKKLAEQLRPH